MSYSENYTLHGCGKAGEEAEEDQEKEQQSDWNSGSGR